MDCLQGDNVGKKIVAFQNALTPYEVSCGCSTSAHLRPASYEASPVFPMHGAHAPSQLRQKLPQAYVRLQEPSHIPAVFPMVSAHAPTQLQQQEYARQQEPCLSGTSARTSHILSQQGYILPQEPCLLDIGFNFVGLCHRNFQASAPVTEIGSGSL